MHLNLAKAKNKYSACNCVDSEEPNLATGNKSCSVVVEDDREGPDTKNLQ